MAGMGELEERSCNFSWMSILKRVTVGLIFTALLLEAFIFKMYTPRMYGMLSLNSATKTILTDFGLLENSPLNGTNYSNAHNTSTRSSGAGNRTSCHLYNDSRFAAALEGMGMEPSELHDFKSPFIITPNVYVNDTPCRAPGVRKKKIISFHLVKKYNNWFINTRQYNRDFKRCPYSECEVDLEGSMTHKADLVLFLCRGLVSPPKTRPPGQLWALGCWETGAHWNYPGYSQWKDAFNLTFSYRTDSDVFSVYRKLAWRHRSQLTLTEKDYLAIMRNKTKTATWWASNCRKDRLNFVKKMQKYIDIDIYGKCGNFSCPWKGDNNCLEKLNTTYKFYLSFENTFCKSYITEKVLKLFHVEAYSHVLPVVKGGLDYENHFPPETLVNGNNFKSPKDLALYLKELANDEKRYVKMLQEKNKLVSPNQSMPDWCDVCKMLHTKQFGVYRDIRKNWSHNACTKSKY